MYARILVALDGLELAEQILPHAECLAEKFGATVTLIRATMPVEQAVAAELGIGGVFVDPTPIIEEERRRGRHVPRVCGRALARPRDRRPVCAARGVARSGDPRTCPSIQHRSDCPDHSRAWRAGGGWCLAT
jgi:nucleotide-binding universal stress UspA family protein